MPKYVSTTFKSIQIKLGLLMRLSLLYLLLNSICIRPLHIIPTYDMPPCLVPTQVHDLVKLGLDISLFERLVRVGGLEVHTLSTQRRMRPQISDLIRRTVYPNLIDAPQTHDRPDVPGMAKNVFFLDHAQPEKSDEFEVSKSNPHEAAMVAALVSIHNPMPIYQS